MNFLSIALIQGLVLAATLIGTKLFIHYAQKRQMLDTPNSRSSHSTPTPRGGGIVFSLVCIAGWWWLGLQDERLAEPVVGLCITGLLVVLLGFIDDLYNLPSTARLLAQSIIATMAIVLIRTESSAILLNALIAIGIIWQINLYNFMDGIDGIAATYGVTIGLSIALLIPASQPHISTLNVTLCSALIGFLVFNWPPAKVFMGDSGSTFLGVSFASIIMLSVEHLSVISIAVLFACFWTDTAWTLITRVVTGQRWMQAHRLHAYQKFARRWNSHKKVTVLYSAYTAFWLFPLAWCHEFYNMDGLATAILAYAPPIVACRYIAAGKTESTTQHA